MISIKGVIMKKYFCILVFILMPVMIVNAQYKIDRFVIGAGGGSLSGSEYKLSGTSGQMMTGNLSGSQHQVNSGFWHTYSVLTSLEEPDILPSDYNLFQNYPNPFNPSTRIKYDLPEESAVSLGIYNLLGEKVADLINSRQPAGRHETVWNAAGYPSGIYICRIEAGNFISVRKLLLLK
jgi:hypothetical protein